MKKVYLWATIAVATGVILTFTSCKKEGVYNPNKKISRIFYQSTGAKQLSQTWTWDGNKLSKIDYNQSGNYLHFEYDKRRVSKITDKNGDYTQIIYSGSKIDKINIYMSNQLAYTWTFTHKNGKISKMSREHFSINKNMSEKKMSEALSFILPAQTSANIAEVMSMHKNQKAATLTSYTVSFTWKGDNVEKEVYELAYDDGSLAITSYRNTYDKKKNPYYGFCGDIDVAYNFSKNNLKTVEETTSSNTVNEWEYTYTYDGNYPKEQIYIRRYSTSTTTTTTTYEYDK
ncbi:MAG: hypothetical protein LBQ64_05435 [Bacteroidales bacterium]|nr:hypothetical protein [Bacteroidales bacterium]